MVAVLVVTHGSLADELVKATRRIVGDVANISSLALGWDDDVAAARARVEESIRSLDHGDGVVVLTDMFGGTPANICLSFLERGKVEIVTGVNLPMLIKFTNLRGPVSLDELARRLADQGRRSITVASELLKGGEGEA
jgi:PTS system mannose-specific IIA component